MKVVVLGAGALGSLFGGKLALSHDVVLVGREAHVAAIGRKGLRIAGAKRTPARIKAVTNASGLERPDLLLVTVKSYDTAAAMRGARGLIGPPTTVLSLQNGITTLDILDKCVPKGRLIGGWTSHGATVLEPGAIRHAGAGDTVIGELDGRRSARTEEIARAFSESGIKTILSRDIRREIWLKGLVNSAINPLTGIVRCENGEIASNSELSCVAKMICEEGSEVARASGFDIGAGEAFRRTMRVAVQTARNRSSMLQDIELGRRTEVDFLNGAITELAYRYKIEAPVNGALTSIIKAISKS
ncbi:MAG: 2-dehydropantoate 2-reductase [Methanobacteriota archaeon]